MQPLSLTLTTYNIHHAAGMDQRVDVPRIADVLRASDAQVVCLQEVDELVIRSGRKRQAAILGSLLGMEASFGPTLRWPMGARYGNAILSALPVNSMREHFLPSKAEQRGLLETRLETPQGEIAVFCTHWGLTAEDRAAQAARVVEILKACDVPALIAGDFNETAGGAALALLRQAGLSELSPTAPTIPSTAPDRQIDFVFGTSQWRAIRGHVVPTLASDHLPVVVELELLSDAATGSSA
jgi:endonuclease/exonuclease/phosphatase family metal-dependent hydrolase